MSCGDSSGKANSSHYQWAGSYFLLWLSCLEGAAMAMKETLPKLLAGQFDHFG